MEKHMDFRHLLNLITESSRQVKEKIDISPKMKVMSLSQFVASETDDEGEIDEAKLTGVTARPFGDDEISKYLSRIDARKKEKTDKYKLPYIHKSNIPIVDEKGKKYNLSKLMSSISERPNKILKQNEKMQHSDGTSDIYYNVSLPALKGLAVDEDKKQFIIIDTCPGAGQCKTYCYAMKGGYVQWKSVSLGQSKLLNWLYNDPDNFMQTLTDEISKLEKKYNKKNTRLNIRWHDAGDFFSPEYLEKSFNIAKQHPNTKFYAYTKIGNVSKAERPNNFIINFSMGAKPSEEKNIDFATTKSSRVVPRVMFNDLIAKEDGKLVKDLMGRMQFANKENEKAFKLRLAAKYSIKPDSILTYDEMLATPVSKEKNKYNVIVMPGDGDQGANRNDVIGTYLLFH
jgi:Gene product 88